MTRVLHLLDRTAGWEQRLAVTQLRQGLPPAEYEQELAVLDAPAAALFAADRITPHSVSRRLGLPTLAGPALERLCRARNIELIHAWGPAAAAAARAGCPSDTPLAVTVFDPGLTARAVQVLRTVAADAGFAVVCAADRVRRRLVEQGLPLEVCALIRPGVDFAALNAARRRPLRPSLHLPEQARVVLTPDPASAAGGHAAAAWSVVVRWYLGEQVAVLIPGRTREAERVRRFIKATDCPEVATFTGDTSRFEELVTAADYLVLGSAADVSITSLAWAMAAGLPIIAPAGYAVTELLADDVNSILFKAPTSWRRRGTVIAGLYDRTARLARIREAARGQAFEVFSIRRFVDQHRCLYENLRSRTLPSGGLHDPLTASG